MCNSFRPLDGESISKPDDNIIWVNYYGGFRPLDGESISKQAAQKQDKMESSFRPLDGESISKLDIGDLRNLLISEFPSPRRGINF